MLAAGGMPAAAKLGWIILCMVSARSAAMAFNRIADAQIDAANPRTAMRAIPAGALSQRFAAIFVTVACGLFVLGAAQLNRATLYLSPVALVIVLLYSYTKRFTRWSHLVLGFALGMAPAAAWIAVRGSLDVRIRSEEHTSELQSRQYLVCRLLLEKKKQYKISISAIVKSDRPT